MRVLGIETSCDETGVAIYSTEEGLLAHCLHSQVDVHAHYGGVVPELASRDHLRFLRPLVDEALRNASLVPAELSAVSYTNGPGLLGALLVGATFAKTLAFTLGIPALAIHHMEGHLLAPFMERPDLQLPLVALLVSGGHTQLVLVRAIGNYEILGTTLDDAAGEAFDKTAKLLELGYPGGPKISEIAKSGDSNRFRFVRPMTNRPGCDFSFSGLKTQVLTQARQLVKDNALNEQAKADLASSFEAAVVDTLVLKCRNALTDTGARTLVVSGGVSANDRLRSALDDLRGEGLEVAYPSIQYCTDNGAMIAFAGAKRLNAGQFDDSFAISVKSRWQLNELSEIR